MEETSRPVEDHVCATCGQAGEREFHRGRYGEDTYNPNGEIVPVVPQCRRNDVEPHPALEEHWHWRCPAGHDWATPIRKSRGEKVPIQ